MEIREFLSFLKDKVVLLDLAKFFGGAISAAAIIVSLESKLPLPVWWFPAFVFLTFLAFIPYLIFRVHDRKKELESGEKYTYKFEWKKPLTKFLIIYTVLGVFSFCLFVNSLMHSDKYLSKKLKRGIVLVDEFSNNSNDESLNHIEWEAYNMISRDLIAHGAKVVSHNQVELARDLVFQDYQFNEFSLAPQLVDYTGADFIITGQFYKNQSRDSLEFHSQILDAETKESIKVFDKKTTSINNYESGLQNLADEITFYWSQKILSEVVKVDKWAFEGYIEALEVWPNYDLAKPLLEKSMEDDDNFERSKFLYLSLLRNTKDYSKADSMINILKQKRDDLDDIYTNLLDAYEADLAGNLPLAAKLFEKDYRSKPKEWFLNTSSAGYLLWYAHKPSEALRTLDNISYEVVKSNYYEERLGIKILSALELGNLDLAFQSIKKFEDKTYNSQLIRYKSRALVQEGDLEKIKKFVADYGSRKIPWGKTAYYQSTDILFSTIREAHTQQKEDLLDELSDYYFELCSSDSLICYKAHKADIAYFTGEFAQADSLINSGFLSKIYKIKLGEESFGQDSVNAKLQDIGKFDLGRTKYRLARFASAANNLELAMQLLKEAYKEGHQFTSRQYHHDPYLTELHDHPEFIEFTKPRG